MRRRPIRCAVGAVFGVLALLALAPPVARADSAEDQYAVAAGHYSAERWEMAVDEFRALIKDHPDYAKSNQATFFLGEALVQLGRYDEAHTEFDRFLKRDPKSTYAPQALFRAGETALLSGKSDAARQSFTKFQSQYPDNTLNAYALLYLGEIALDAKDAAGAEKALTAALAKFPDAARKDEVQLQLARVRELQDDATAAAKVYSSLAAGANLAIAELAQLRLGQLQLKAGNLAEAEQAYQTFEEKYPASRSLKEARLGRAKTLFNEKHFNEARELLEPLTHEPALTVESGDWLGLSYAAEQNWSAAEKAFNAAIEVDPKSPLLPQVRYHLADSQYRAGDFAAAIATLEPTVGGAASPSESKPDGLAAHPTSQSDDSQRQASRFLLALCYQATKRHPDALALFDDLAQTATGDLAAKIQLARAASLVDSEKSGDATQALEAFLKTQPTGAEANRALAQLAVCYARAKQFDAAKEKYEQLKAGSPQNDLLMTTTQQLADIAATAGETHWSGDLYAALSADGNPAEFVARGLAGLGWQQLQSGDAESAAATFDKLLEKFPNDPAAADAAWGRGQAFEKLRKFDPALASYQIILDHHRDSKRFDDALLASARLHNQLRQTEAAIELYRKFVDERADSPQLDVAHYGWAWALRDAGQSAAADEQFQILHDKFPASHYWFDGTYRLAESAVAARQSARAEKLLTEIQAAKPPADVAQHALYLSGQIAAADQHWDRAAEIMGRLLHDFPDTPLKLPANYWIAEAAYRRQQYDDADQLFAKLATQAAGRKDAWLAMIPLRQAQILAQSKKWAEAEALAAPIEAAFPGFSEQYEVDYLLGRALAAQADFDGARAKYTQVIHSATGGKSETAAMAQWMIGETYFHQEQFELALREYLRVEILYQYPRWQAAALLQAGKCQESLSRWKEAAGLYARLIKLYPNTEFTDEAKRRLEAVEGQLAAASQKTPKG